MGLDNLHLVPPLASCSFLPSYLSHMTSHFSVGLGRKEQEGTTPRKLETAWAGCERCWLVFRTLKSLSALTPQTLGTLFFLRAEKNQQTLGIFFPELVILRGAQVKNLLKQGNWQTLTVGRKKKKIWVQSGKEILARRGIISWQEDPAHLESLLTMEQPGSWTYLDTAQVKWDKRKIQVFVKEGDRKKKEETSKEATKMSPLKNILKRLVMLRNVILRKSDEGL